ncbi:MAG TPA: hypothetical protein VFQ96_04310 [Microbacteriaceae bacterium]|nr:hypothetical protein [Microbacteriaceae bacterium]
MEEAVVEHAQQTTATTGTASGKDAAARNPSLTPLADALIPAAEGELSASQAGVPGIFLDQAVTLRPDLAKVLDEAARTLATGMPATELLASWQKTQPDEFQKLFLLVRGAYFLNPEVQRRFHYDGVTPHPLSEAVPPDYTDLLPTVIAAGPRYRRATDNPTAADDKAGDVSAARSAAQTREGR